MPKGTPDWQWIFALSIDEDLRWAATRVDVRRGKGSYCPKSVTEVRHGIFGVVPKAHPDTGAPYYLDTFIEDHFVKYSAELDDLFQNAVAVGVSTIGVVDPAKNRLLNIDRKDWKRHDEHLDDPFIVDFNALMKKFFKNTNLAISTQNDATAKCIMEFHRQYDTVNDPNITTIDPVDLLFYASFNDGVNGSFVQGVENNYYFNPNEYEYHPSKPIAAMHQELGHIVPPPYKYDKFSTTYRACAAHSECFISRAGGARINNEWNADLFTLWYQWHKDSRSRIFEVDDRYQPWRIVAYYIGLFCWNAVLILQPKRILLGGIVIFPELVPYVEEEFWRFSTYQGRPYINYREVRARNFICCASAAPDVAGVMGALELARRACVPNAGVVSNNVVKFGSQKGQK